MILKRLSNRLKDGAAQFIFDVRNNTGGSLTSVVNILDFLLPEGTLVTLKDNAGKETVHSSDANSFSKKYAVLINGFTYSGGELFARLCAISKRARLSVKPPTARAMHRK